VRDTDGIASGRHVRWEGDDKGAYVASRNRVDDASLHVDHVDAATGWYVIESECWVGAGDHVRTHTAALLCCDIVDACCDGAEAGRTRICNCWRYPQSIHNAKRI